LSNKSAKTKSVPGKKHQQSVFKEAWENMNEDMARIMPGFLVKRLQGSKGKTWVMVFMAVVELLILGVIGKFVFDWFTK
jgi:hypothetical protein